MPRAFCLVLVTGLAFAVPAARAAGLQADRPNKVIIQGRFAEASPAFLLIFSEQPLRNAGGALLQSFSVGELTALQNDRNRLALRVSGKPAARGQVEYFFGSTTDAAASWNAGPDFRWQDWARFSPDVWDHLCVVALPANGAPTADGPSAVVANVVVIRGGKFLYDSRTRASYPNRKAFDASFPPADLAARQGRSPVLNLAGRMEQFRREYYELGQNRVLATAYADLAQTDKRKYANRGNAWCSEFSSYVYRQCGIMTPDPNRSDVHWRSMREYFERNGHVYPAREVAAWSDERKRATIKPGSFVSILIGKQTHSILFTAWELKPGQPIRTYVGVSGNNKGMVWPHAPLKLPTPEQFAAMSADELRDYDQKVYFAVPSGI